MAYEGLPAQSWVKIGSMRTPGWATITGAALVINWNTPQAYGVSGGFTSFIGVPLSDFEIRITLTEPEHFDQWEVMARAYFVIPPTPPATGALLPLVGPMPVEISHPLLTIPPLSIKKVVFTSISMAEPDENLKFTIIIKCKEWRKPVPALSKPNAAIPEEPGVTPTAKTQSDRDLASKIEELDNVRAGK